MELGSVTEQKKKNIESETVVTDLICIVVLFSAVLGQHCGLHVCTTLFNSLDTYTRSFFFFIFIWAKEKKERERVKKKERKDTENITLHSLFVDDIHI